MADNFANVEKLINKAAQSDKPDDAMKFAQAALNAANAICCQISAKAQASDRNRAA